jgi:hypothetical protein
MLKVISFILVLIFPMVTFAATCPKEPIKEGEPAPCSGYVVSEQVLAEASKLPERIKLLEDKLQLKEMVISFKEEKITLLTEVSDKKDVTITNLQKVIIDNNKNNDLKIGLAVGGSILGTALVCIGLAFAFSAASKIQVTTVQP